MKQSSDAQWLEENLKSLEKAVDFLRGELVTTRNLIILTSEWATFFKHSK